MRARRKAEEVLDFLELYPYRKKIAGDLPLGVQKIVGLARALAAESKLLLLDEVGSGLSREEKEDLARFIFRIKYEKRIAALWVEHDIKLVSEVSDRMICLNYGCKIADGTPQEVISDPAVTKTYLSPKA